MKYFLFLLTALTLTTISCKKESQSEIDEKKILEYAENNNLDLESHESGIYYIVEKEGTGTAHPNFNSQIIAHYKGSLLNGQVFDSSIGGAPLSFKLTQVIKGWQIAIPLMKKGEKTKFFIPSNLAYGESGSGSIPANSVLIFDIELIDF